MSRNEYISDVETAHGSISCFRNDLIGEALVCFGEWAWLEVLFCDYLIIKFCGDSPRVFDVGAFVGTFGLGLVRLSKQRKGNIFVLFVEPEVDSCRLLDRNVGGAGEVFNGLVALPGNYEVSVDHKNRGATRYRRRDSGGVSATSLRSIRGLFGSYNFLKIDVEGFEKEVLQTDQVWIRESKPVLYLECNDSYKSLDSYDLLRWLGYRVYYFGFPAFNKRNYNGVHHDTLFNGAYEAALVAVNGIVDLPDVLAENGCFVCELSSRNDLIRMMWHTPRYVDARLRDLSRPFLLGELEKVSSGIKYDEYLFHLKEKDLS